MSNGITLSAATRQNLLSLQGTADLLATTQNRLATNKKVNSALDNPTNFFTADALSSRSTSLSKLLDGISNGIQTIQAANTGLTKLQGLTDQLKSVAQQALSSSNAFSTKATSTSTALTGATAANLLSTGPTQAVSDTAIGSGATAVAAARTASSIFSGAAPTVTGAAFTMPAKAVAGSYTGTNVLAGSAIGVTLTVTIDGGSAQTLTLDGTSSANNANQAESLADIQQQIAANTTLTNAGVTASVDGSGHLVISGTNDGKKVSVQGSANTLLGDTTAHDSTGNSVAGTTTLKVNGTDVTISGGKSTDGAPAILTAALAAINAQTATTKVTATASGTTALILTGDTSISSFSVTNTDGTLGFGAAPTTVASKTATAQSVTINGQQIDIASGSTQAQTIAAINAASSTTGVTASQDSTTASKIKLTGSSDGASFSLVASASNTLGFPSGTAQTIAGTFNPTATTLVTALGFATGDNFTVNGQSVNISAGETISSLVQKVSTATNGTVSASFNATDDKFTFTATDSNTAVTLGNGSSATSLVSNLGYNVGKTSFAAGLGSGSASPLAGTSLTVKVGTGVSTSFTFGSAPGQISNLTQLNASLATVNAQASIDSVTGKIAITSTNDFGADNLSVTVAGGTAFTSGTSSAIVGGDGATTRNGLVSTYNNLLTQVNQLASDAGFNGLNLLAGDSLKLSFNEKGSSSLNVQGTAISASNLGLSNVGNLDFQENGSIAKVMTAISSASAQLKAQASSLGSNLAVVQNRQDFTKQIINVLDTGAANLTNADLNEEAANSQALSTRNSLGISALSLANQAQQGVLQLLR